MIRITSPRTHFGQLAIAAVLLFVAASSLAEPTLAVDIDSAVFAGHQVLGEIRVDDIGAVSLSARRDGSRIIVLASDSSGRVIGRGESVAGMTRTPLHVKTTQGLQKISIIWRDDK